MGRGYDEMLAAWRRWATAPLKYQLFGLFTLALFARLAVWIIATRDWAPTSDADQYLLLARSLANGEGFSLQFPQATVHPTAFRPPLFPMILTPVAWLGGDALWPLRLCGVLLGSADCILTLFLLRKLCSPTAALAGAALVALYPQLAVNDSVILSEGLGLLLLQGTLLAAVNKRPALAGLCLGGLLLTRPNAYLVVVFVVLYLLWQATWKQALVATAFTLFAISPWIFRNHVQIGSPRLTTSEGFNLAAIYGAPSQKLGRFTDPVLEDPYNDPGVRLSQFDEATWNRELTTVGIDGLKDNPSYVLTTVRRNFLALFEIEPSRNTYAETADGRNLRLRQVSLPVFYAVTIVGMYGLWIRRKDPLVVLFIALAIQFMATSLVLISVPRLRAPIDLIMCFGVAFTVESWGQRRAKRPISDPSSRDSLATSIHVSNESSAA